MRLAEEAGLLVAQGENLGNECGIVPLLLVADLRQAFPTEPTEVVVLRILERRRNGRLLEREAPGFGATLTSGRLLSSGEGAGREAGQTGFVGDEVLPVIRRIEDVFRILLRFRGEGGIELSESLLLCGRKVRAILLEISHRLLQETATHTRQRLGFRGRGVSLEHGPDLGVERERSVKRSHLR